MAESIRVLILLWVVAVATSLSAASTGDLQFSTQCVTEDKYTEFIHSLRARLTKGVRWVYDIPVLNNTVHDAERFILVDLSNFAHTITAAIDVVNAKVVAYAAGNRSYFFEDSPPAAFDILFINTEHTSYDLQATYEGLERGGGKARREIPLGISSLDTAISGLWYSNSDDTSVATSLLVVIQMLSDAARFRFIEARLRASVRNREDFKPDVAMLSLENKWESLSAEIVQSVQGVFINSVALLNCKGQIVRVGSVTSIYVKGIAFLLYQSSSNNNNNAIHASAAAAESRIMSVVEGYPVWQSSPGQIHGWNGLCLDVRNGNDSDGTAIQVWPCGQQRNQQWTIKSDDRSIRSLGKCMVAYSYRDGAYAMIYNCDIGVPDNKAWKLHTDGTIEHRRSGYVLTATKGESGTTVTLQSNNYTVGQCWGVGVEIDPVVTFIVGFKDLCMQASQDYSNMWLQECVPGSNEKQQWAIYSDGTIRVNGNRRLCLASDGSMSGSLIVIRACQGGANQRWLFKNDGSLLNPGSGLAMDVKSRDVSLHQIILYQPTGNDNQRWLAAF